MDVLPRDPFALASLLGAKVNRNVESQFAIIGDTDELIYDDLPPTTWVRNSIVDPISLRSLCLSFLHMLCVYFVHFFF